MEVGLQYYCHLQRREELKYFTTTQAKIAIILAPFDNGREAMFEIVLKVPNDLNNSITEMPMLLSDLDFTDAKIICEGQTFKCHKTILALKSNVFQTMLYMTEFSEKISGTIHIEDFNAKTMNTMLKYMYQNKITYKEATDLNLIVAANKYNIVDLVLKCEKIISLTMSMTNILDVLAVSYYLPTMILYEKAISFFSQRMGKKEALQGPKWKKLKTDTPGLVLKIYEICSKVVDSNVDSGFKPLTLSGPSCVKPRPD
jgi:hypothetical protein